MTRKSRFLRLTLILSLASLVLPPAAVVRATARSDFDAFVDQFLVGFYAFRPGRATQDGVHEYDGKLAGFSRDEIVAETTRLKAALVTAQGMKAAELDSSRKVDLQILTSKIQSEILTLETIRPWEKDPNYYIGLVTDGVYTLAARSFASPEERLRHVIDRERLVGQVLSSALENLNNPPKIWTQVAVEQAGGAVDFFKTTVPGAFEAVTDTALKSEFLKVNGETVAQMQSFVSYLKDDLLPVSNGDFKLGPEVFEKKLLYDEMCDTPVYRLEKYGEDELKRLQLEVQNTAIAIDPQKTAKDLFRILSVDHPEPNRLVDETSKLLESLRKFCIDRNIVTFPSDERVQVKATPEFQRSYIFAAMDAPGAFETKGREAFYYVTPPDPSWDPITQDDHMRTYNRFALPVVSMHEAYPGHYLQYLWSLKTPGKVRKVFGCSSNSEGWGLYCEQMMLDEGYANKDPRYRLFQLRLALLRTCRYLVAIRMHTGDMTYDEAVDFFMKEAFQERVSAEREARRGTSDPTYLVYQLGKMQILKLRDDYKRFRGDKYTLKEFHDRLLSYGEPPLKILRQILMPGDKGTVL